MAQQLVSKLAVILGAGMNPTPAPSEPGTGFSPVVDHLEGLVDDKAVPGDPPEEAHHHEHLRRRQEDEALPVLVEAPMFFQRLFSLVSTFWQTSRGPVSAVSTSKVCK